MRKLVKRQLKKLEAIKTNYEMMRRDLVDTITQNPDNKIQNNAYRHQILGIDKDIQRIDTSIRSCQQSINSLF
jgi:hypothetical protein